MRDTIVNERENYKSGVDALLKKIKKPAPILTSRMATIKGKDFAKAKGNALAEMIGRQVIKQSAEAQRTKLRKENATLEGLKRELGFDMVREIFVKN